MPEHFVWNRSNKTWTPRKRGFSIGRIVSVNPAEGERYYLRLLLNHIRGATCFDDLKFFRNKLCTSFREAAVLNGLVEDDDCFRLALTEACVYQMPPSLRRLFATFLCYCNPVNALPLWEEFRAPLSEDFTRLAGITQRASNTMDFRDIGYQLESMGKHIKEYMLIDDHVVSDEEDRVNKEINDELTMDVPFSNIQNVDRLNADQKLAYDEVMSRVLSGQPGAFFIDGPGGTGKTFLYTVLLAMVRSKGYIALATASSGVAASIMHKGRTAHSRFKISITVDEFMTCSVSKRSKLADLIRSAKLIIWDEAPMVRKQAIEAFERMLHDICGCDQPFGGKVDVFGGDFRQVLPVVPKGSMDQTIQASLVMSVLWLSLVKIRLKINMRAQLDPQFADYLLAIGEGTVVPIVEDIISLPSNMTLPYDGPNSLDTLINLTFPDLNSYSQSLDTHVNRAILSTKNEFVDSMNDTIIDRFPGAVHEYLSFDTESSHQGLQEDFFNSMTPSGSPPHILKLKYNCPVMLLRNIDPSKGLCNGTRLICKTFTPNLIGAEIASGLYKGKHVFLRRIPLTPSPNELNAFPFTRKQFPIRLCFCMTLNKSQGQTLDFVEIYLPQPVFSHGQLYIALSRARESASVAILVIPLDDVSRALVTTRNVVFKEVLSLSAAD